MVTRARRRDGGFTMVEVLVAMTVMTIGMIGILALYKGAMSASGYSRRATEAAILAEDKLEQLRTLPLATVAPGTDHVDATGVANADGPFDRTWTFAVAGTLSTITVAVSWSEGDGLHTITFRTLRNLN